jgi:uncharacterized repeat protein (TIGR01451 family)
MATACEPKAKQPKRWPWLAAAVLCLLPGCFGVTHNPSCFPHWFPFGDIIRTHAKPGGCSYWSDFDRHACRLEVRPCESTNPVQTQHVLIATIYDECGQPRRGRRVEWILEGVGNIIEVDESGIFSGRGYKVDNKYAVSYTDYKEHTITRGNLDPNDDFTIRPGQTWCVISSAVEGDTHVTCYAPEIYNWDNHKVFVTKHWVDAEWRFPPPATNRVGTEHVFTTQIWRHTDHQPLAGYRIRYRILDGPSAAFMPARSQEAVAVSDINGNASVSLVQLEPRAGVNRIGIEVIRAPDPSLTSSAGIVIGHGETSKTWEGPQITLKKTAPPAVPVGQEVPYTLTVSNGSRVECQDMTLRDAVPDTLQYVRSEPPASVQGNQLIWTLAGLNGGQAHTVNVFFKATKPGVVTNTAEVQTRDGLHDQQQASTQITTPGLAVQKNGPQTGVVGVPLQYEIVVTNTGSAPVNNVALVDDFDAGLEHESHATKLNLPVGTLGPGESKSVQLTLTPKQEGQLVNRVTATADGDLKASAQHPVTVSKATLRIGLSGPPKRYLNRPADWNITVTNTGQTPLSNVTVHDQLPPELKFVSASQGGGLVNNEVVWAVGALQAGEQKTLQVKTTSVQKTPQALNVAVATADPGGLTVQATAPIQIMGLPAFRLEVQDIEDPIEVGGKTTYRIDVLNTGTLPGTQVQVKAVVPKQLKVINTTGPTNAQVNGSDLLFAPLDQLQPGQKVSYGVDVQALEAGDIRFHVELTSTELKEPVVEEEPTTVYVAPTSSPTGAPPAGTPPTAPPPVGPPTAPPPVGSPTAPPPTAPPGAGLGRPQ